MSAAVADVDVRTLARRRANTELGLLVIGLLAVLTAYALVGLAQEAALPPGLAEVVTAATVCTRMNVGNKPYDNQTVRQAITKAAARAMPVRVSRVVSFMLSPWL